MTNVRDLLLRSPFWAVSGIFHLAVLLGATAIGFATRTLDRPQPAAVTLTVSRPPSAPIRDPIKPGPRVQNGSLIPLQTFPEFEEGEVWESNDGEHHGSMKGDSWNFVSLQRGAAGGPTGSLTSSAVPGASDAIGTGPGAGSSGLLGGPRGSFRNRRPPFGHPDTDAAVLAGLRWLARHQDSDGHWSTDRFGDRCPGAVKCAGSGSRSHDVGLTGLALLAFLGAGHVPTSREAFEDPLRPGSRIRFRDCVREALRWLRDRQDGEGCFTRQEGEFMYDHAIATLAVAEAWWLTGSPLYREPAQRGIDFLLKARNPGYAWRYTVRPGDNDTSVTGWCVMALKSAELSGLAVDPAAYDGVRSWLDRVTGAQGVVGYEAPGDAGSVIPGVNERWQSHPAMTAVGLLCRIFIDRKRNDPWCKLAAQSILKDLPAWDDSRKTIDFYYWYYAALALFQYDSPGGAAWKAFNESMKRALLPFQHGAGREGGLPDCRDGSFDPAVDRWGSIGGRVYATAINVLTLEVYYRYQSVFVGSRGGR